MHPQAPQDAHSRRRHEVYDSDPDSDQTMTPGSSSRKKPVCHSCGEPMAGHKRPNGSPICPRDSASPSPPRSRTQTTTPPRASGGTTLLSRISPEDVRSSPTESGYWRRPNPNWVEPAHYARMSAPQVPQRGDTVASWHSTELDEVSVASLPQRARLSQDSVEEVEREDVDASDAEYANSRSQSSSFTSVTRQISKLFGRSTPLASVFSAPSEEVDAIENVAHEHGLSTAVIHRPRAIVKAEPTSPGSAVGGRSRSTLARESSWWVFVGRDRSAVDALAGSQTRTALAAAAAKPEREPYDYDTGLVKERNEGVGAYPVDPRTVRQNFCDVIIAAVVSAFCAVWFLSLM
ncbi:hypothetical protein TRAPUB_2040 [Trametes pubescens]|uniref:Uncharacterized protein n=1 Tax=Trametes pubescens TaxID=154538 RepID=A0A1M2VHR7_TRAPU|nr:hypothetical protein TRAPUB_2040 [Trametes pubescens]